MQCYFNDVVAGYPSIVTYASVEGIAQNILLGEMGILPLDGLLHLCQPSCLVCPRQNITRPWCFWRVCLSPVQVGSRSFVPGPISMPDMTGRPGRRTMEMFGGSTASYLARAPRIPLFVLIFIGLETKNALDYQGRAGDHFHCTVDPSPGHIRCRQSLTPTPTPDALGSDWVCGWLVGDLSHAMCSQWKKGGRDYKREFWGLHAAICNCWHCHYWAMVGIVCCYWFLASVSNCEGGADQHSWHHLLGPLDLSHYLGCLPVHMLRASKASQRWENQINEERNIHSLLQWRRWYDNAQPQEKAQSNFQEMPQSF